MKERGIIFNGDMVRATLSGEKTQTRRIMKVQPPKAENFPGSSFGLCRAVHPDSKMFSLNQYDRLPKHPTDWDLDGSVGVARNTGFPMIYRCPFGQSGDRLWVRETFAALEPGSYEQVKPRQGHCQDLRYAATDRLAKSDANIRGYKWIPSIHMPRYASRILLEITGVRVERLNDISEEDCWAEGIDAVDGRFDNAEIIDMARKTGCCIDDAKPMFALLWQSIYGEESWQANPWCWTITFKRIEGA
ncbi:hypothetical protein [Pectobacterium versatile]|uniref:hypothetical protein n=1 Tax=Pectobacterium versatile TaxID=2488639 RepID=UPI001F3C31BE|nr:hypothetical protein [Pectobacterium versatile]